MYVGDITINGTCFSKPWRNTTWQHWTALKTDRLKFVFRTNPIGYLIKTWSYWWQNYRLEATEMGNYQFL